MANSAAAGAWMSKEMAAMVPNLRLEFEAQQEHPVAGWFEDSHLSGGNVKVNAIKIRSGRPPAVGISAGTSAGLSTGSAATRAPQRAAVDWHCISCNKDVKVGQPCPKCGDDDEGERRIDTDGNAYTFEEFQTEYGPTPATSARWRASPPVWNCECGCGTQNIRVEHRCPCGSSCKIPRRNITYYFEFPSTLDVKGPISGTYRDSIGGTRLTYNGFPLYVMLKSTKTNWQADGKFLYSNSDGNWVFAYNWSDVQSAEGYVQSAEVCISPDKVKEWIDIYSGSHWQGRPITMDIRDVSPRPYTGAWKMHKKYGDTSGSSWVVVGEEEAATAAAAAPAAAPAAATAAASAAPQRQQQQLKVDTGSSSALLSSVGRGSTSNGPVSSGEQGQRRQRNAAVPAAPAPSSSANWRCRRNHRNNPLAKTCGCGCGDWRCSCGATNVPSAGTSAKICRGCGEAAAAARRNRWIGWNNGRTPHRDDGSGAPMAKNL